MHRQSTRELATKLRTAGYTYKYISKKTGLSKSTLSGWLTEIPFTPNQEMVAELGKSRAAAIDRIALFRQREAQKLREQAEAELGNLSDRDLFMFGLGLYMGEGNKTQDIVRVANADPSVIRCMISWFRVMEVTDTQFSARVYLYPDSDVEKSLQYWARITGIPRSQFQKTYIDVRTDKKKHKEGKLPHGTFHLGVRAGGRKEFGVLFSRRILALLQVVREST